MIKILQRKPMGFVIEARTSNSFTVSANRVISAEKRFFWQKKEKKS